MKLIFSNLDRRPAILDSFVSVISTRAGEQHTYLGNQNPITRRDTHGCPLSILVQPARPDGQHLRLVELLDARLGQEDAARRLCLGLDALHEHAVEEGDKAADRADRGCLFPICVSTLLEIRLSNVGATRFPRRTEVGGFGKIRSITQTGEYRRFCT